MARTYHLYDLEEDRDVLPQRVAEPPDVQLGLSRHGVHSRRHAADFRDLSTSGRSSQCNCRKLRPLRPADLLFSSLVTTVGVWSSLARAVRVFWCASWH